MRGSLFFFGVHIGVYRSGNPRRRRPFYPRQFLLRDQIVSLEAGHSPVPRQSYDLEVIVSGQAKIIQGTMAQVVEGEIIYPRSLTGGPERLFEVIKRDTVEEKHI